MGWVTSTEKCDGISRVISPCSEPAIYNIEVFDYFVCSNITTPSMTVILLRSGDERKYN